MSTSITMIPAAPGFKILTNHMEHPILAWRVVDQGGEVTVHPVTIFGLVIPTAGDTIVDPVGGWWSAKP